MHSILLMYFQLLLLFEWLGSSESVSIQQNNESAAIKLYNGVPWILYALSPQSAVGESEPEPALGARGAWPRRWRPALPPRSRCDWCGGRRGSWLDVLGRLLRRRRAGRVRSACRRCCTAAAVLDGLSECAGKCCGRGATTEGGDVSTTSTPARTTTAAATTTQTTPQAQTTNTSTSTTNTTRMTTNTPSTTEDTTTVTEPHCSGDSARLAHAMCGDSAITFGEFGRCSVLCICDANTGQWHWGWEPGKDYCPKLGEPVRGKTNNESALEPKRCGPLAMQSVKGNECPMYCTAMGRYGYIGDTENCPRVMQFPPITASTYTHLSTTTTTATSAATTTPKSLTTTKSQQCTKESKQEHSNVKSGRLSVRYDQSTRCAVMCYCNKESDQWEWGWEKGKAHCDELGKPVKSTDESALYNRWCGHLAMRGKKGGECPMYCYGKGKYGYIKNPGNDCPSL